VFIVLQRHLEIARDSSLNVFKRSFHDFIRLGWYQKAG